MTEATKITKKSPPTRRREKISIPVYNRRLVLKSEQAKRIAQRGFRRTASSLYRIDVILRIVGDRAHAEQVEEMITDLITAEHDAIQTEKKRMEKLVSDNGITELPEYTHPAEIVLPISSPQSSRFVALIQEVDSLMPLLDTLWLNHIINNTQRSQGAWSWQTRVLSLGRRLVNIEMRAMKAARSRGKEAEVKNELAETPESLRDEDVDQAAVA